MRAIVMDQIAGPLAVQEVEEPRVPVGGVVITVAATGLCRSDWHAWAGHDEIALPTSLATSSPASSPLSVPV